MSEIRSNLHIALYITQLHLSHFLINLGEISSTWRWRHNFILTNVPCIFCYFVLWPKNAQIFHKLSHSYGFFFFLNICSSVHRNSRLKTSNEMQQYADIYLLLNYSTCFGRPSRPSSGVHKTVVAASVADHTIWGASFLKRDQINKYNWFGPVIQQT